MHCRVHIKFHMLRWASNNFFNVIRCHLNSIKIKYHWLSAKKNNMCWRNQFKLEFFLPLALLSYFSSLNHFNFDDDRSRAQSEGKKREQEITAANNEWKLKIFFYFLHPTEELISIAIYVCTINVFRSMSKWKLKLTHVQRRKSDTNFNGMNIFHLFLRRSPLRIYF